MSCPYCGHEHLGRPRVNFNCCPTRDLLSQAIRTGRIHAERGGRCATDTANRLFGPRIAAAYERGYRYEIERRAR
jgi:hypothetical protein